MKDKTDEVKDLFQKKTGNDISVDNAKYLIAGWLMSGKEIEELVARLSGEEVKYSNYTGFATPSLVLMGSDTKDRGYIVDTESEVFITDSDGLICGWWSKGFFDDRIHLLLMKPVAAICDERQGWINKQVLLKEPISSEYSYSSGEDTPVKEPKVKPKKKEVVFDSKTKQFRMM